MEKSRPTLDNQKHRWDSASEWLVASFAVAASIAAFAGIAGGNLDRIVRFHWIKALLSIGLFTAAVVLGVLARTSSTHARAWATFGLVSFMSGMGLLIVTHAETVRAQERPAIQANLTMDTSGSKLEFRASASELDNDQYVYVLVQGTNASHVLDPNTASVDPTSTSPPLDQVFVQTIYRSRIGSSPDGTVDATISVPVSDGLYDHVRVILQILRTAQQKQEVDQNATEAKQCQQTPNTACATILLPAGSGSKS